MDASEIEQYRAAIRGDRDAFEMIIRTHSRALFAIAYGVLQNREEAEDAVQDALIKAWKSRRRVRDAEKFPAWLGTVTRYRARDILKRRRSIPLFDEIAESLVQETETVNDATLSDHDVHSALATLPALHRTALALRYFEDLDYKSIESLLGLTDGALRGILGRALASMRRRLKPALASLE
jgi:RNA polymerase sigma-70 factor, ECF subfamily